MSETVTEVDGILNSDVLTKCTIFFSPDLDINSNIIRHDDSALIYVDI
jgi:hypothetical protein